MEIEFNRGWLFWKEGGTPRTVDIPHDAMLEEKRDSNCVNGKQSGFFPGGKYCYEKEFTLGEEALGKCVELFFEGVYQNCQVSVNGITVGSHRYGYTEFRIDISGQVRQGANRVTVLVDNSLEPNCRWYSGSGIYRPVHLYIRERLHPEKLEVRTKSWSPAVIEILADEGAEIAVYDGREQILAGGPGEYRIPEARLWSAEMPYLYTCTATLGGETIQTRFGIRKLEWSAGAGLLVNGQRTLLRGGCIHHDNGVLGACGFADAEERRIRILKEAGYNAVRSAHNPMSRAMLDACDRLGMYVMDEAFDGWYLPKNYHDYSRWFSGDWRDDLEAMVEKDRNHPCVILYSIGNEVSETADERGVETCGELAGYVRSLDPSRPVTCGINVLLNVYSRMGMGIYKEKGEYRPEPLPPKGKGYREKKTGSAFFNAMAERLGGLMFFMSGGKRGDRACRGAAGHLDIVGLNYAASRYDADVKAYPERMMVGSETMVTDLPYNWERVRRYPAVVGDFVWAAWDYLGEAGVGNWMYHSDPGLPILAGSGTIDMTGSIGAEAVYQQVVWGLRKEPYLCVRPLNHTGETPTRGAWRFTDALESWTWHGWEGKPATVEVFAQGAFVRLELEGEVIGQKRIKNQKCLFRTKYRPGTLTAIALDQEGKEISRHSLKTGGRDTVLTAQPEKWVLRANGQDLCFLPIEFTDKEGTLQPYREQTVEVSVEGAATLQGFGSAAVKTEESYLGSRFRAFRGRCLAVLRAGTEPGRARVTVKSSGVEPVVVEVEVRDA